ncbi:MAG: uracil-DNA glycosylase family protein [Anaerolineae bacterium]
MSSRSSASTEGALNTLHSEMRACRRCLEAGFAITPGAIFSGHTSARVMIVGQAPGVTEVEAQRPFNASSGRRLFQWLLEAGWEEDDFRATQYMTAITKCYPGKSPGGRGDRAPSHAEQKLCASFLQRELALVQPKLIVPVGGLAIRRFLGKVKLTDVVGTAVQVDEGHWIVPLPHPSGASLWLNKPEHQALVQRAIEHLGKLRDGL